MYFNDFTAAIPSGLSTEEFVLRPLAVSDVEADYAAVMETRERLRLWEQSGWPAEDFTLDGNLQDLIGLEERHRKRKAFTYTVLSPQGTECLGCVYIFPTTAAFLRKSSVTALAEYPRYQWDDVAAVVFFWARLSRMQTGMDARLLNALRTWFSQEWKLEPCVYVTSELFTQQAVLLQSTDLKLQFEFVEPGKPGKYLVFG